MRKILFLVAFGLFACFTFSQAEPPCCTGFDQSGNCNRCAAGLTLQQGSCYKIAASGCARTEGSRCAQCESGFIKMRDLCIKMVSNCLSHSPEGGCSRCNQGYIGKNGVCFEEYAYPNLPDHCNMENEYGCVECDTGYYLANQRCQPNELGCLKHFQQRCIACDYGFSIQSGRCVIDGCSSYGPDGCRVCNQNYISNQQGGCAIENCFESRNGRCLTCQPSYRIESGQCVATGMITCASFSLVEEQRVLDQPLETAASQSTIPNCQGSTHLQNSQCVANDPNCQEYYKQSRNNEICRSCRSGWLLMFGSCKEKGLTCQADYYPSENVCLPKEPGCVYNYGKCSYCSPPFEFNQQTGKCVIDGCAALIPKGCQSCRNPFQLQSSGVCKIPHCVSATSNACQRCSPGYHLKDKLFCVVNDVNCYRYDEEGNCANCARNYMLINDGECGIAKETCTRREISGECSACTSREFLNRFLECQIKDQSCESYNNGICSNCMSGYFLYQFICFPYSPGCVEYNGKDCVRCKVGYQLTRGECFNLRKPSLKMQGQGRDDSAEIIPIDITKQKYNIENLSPISKLGTLIYSSVYSQEHSAAAVGNNQYGVAQSKGWRAMNQKSGEYVGFTIENGEPVTFYALQLQYVRGYYIREFYLEYSVDGVNFIRMENSFDGTQSQRDIATFYFNGIYAKSIRIVIESFNGWPATKIEFFYFNKLRFRRITNIKSLRSLEESIDHNFVDRMNNQLMINKRMFFSPAHVCTNKSPSGCFTGLELSSARTITTLKISFNGGFVSKVHITYSTNGQSFNCWQNCRDLTLNRNGDNEINLNRLFARNVRVHPVAWEGSAKMRVRYEYE